MPLQSPVLTISAVGERFEDSTEQQMLLSILRDTETKQGWPTGHARDQLQHVWSS